MSKNTYMIADGEILFRRARADDNFAAIARLIYETDPSLYLSVLVQ